ncbi:MAG TPA: PAS domain S-box protein, partial [Vicinamibacterales bacterium]|nr:PAS domain S-box protein [Vicinamibacterales bacterium]
MAQLVLNVDDFEPQRHARSAVLRKAGFDVIEAATGRQALAMVSDRQPALVVLDVHLPDIDGLEVCRRLKAAPATAGVLVLHVSATFIEPGARVAALENGADGYLPEPLDPKELVAQVRSLLRLAAAESQARQADDALRESQEQLRRFFDASGVLMVVLELEDDDIVYRMPNANLARFYGMSAEEMSGKRGRDLGLPEPLIREWVATFRRCEADGQPVVLEYPFQPGNPEGWFHATISPIRSAAPGSRFAVTIVDISERKRIEEQLRASEERLRLAQRAGGVGSFDWDPKTGETLWTPELEAIYGMAAPTDPTKRQEAWLAGVHPDDRDHLLEETTRWLASQDPEREWEYRFMRPGGEQRWIAGRSLALRDASGEVRRVVGTNIDITERKRVEQALREALDAAQRSEAEIKSIYDSAPIGLCIFDKDGRFVRVNRRLAEINGPPAEAHIGRTIREVVPDIADQTERLLRQVVDTGTPARGVEVIGEVPREPGVIGTWIENWHPVTDGTGAVVGVNVGVEDVTRLKQIEEALRQANRVKDEFLATLSHELRTPLNAILGWSQLLQRGGLDETTTRQALDAVVRNAEAQRQLISDVLDVSRMVSGKVRLEMTQVDLAETLRLAVESMRPAAHGKGVELEGSCALRSAIVRADGDRAQQIIWNLLSNALKFTPSGGRVTVALRRGARGYELSVTDTGIGIRPDFLPYVFDRFAQADSSTTRPHSGLGLGLSIVRQLVELHGGRVSAASEGEGKGA